MNYRIQAEGRNIFSFLSGNESGWRYISDSKKKKNFSLPKVSQPSEEFSDSKSFI